MANSIVDDITAILKPALADTARDLQVTAHDVAVYTAQRARHLSNSHGEPGWEEALAVEKQNVALMAGIQTVEAADAADARVLGIIDGVLTVFTGVLGRTLGPVPA